MHLLQLGHKNARKESKYASYFFTNNFRVVLQVWKVTDNTCSIYDYTSYLDNNWVMTCIAAAAIVITVTAVVIHFNHKTSTGLS